MQASGGAKKSAGEAIGRALGGRRLGAAAIVLCAGLTVASCAGTGSEDGFSAYVADHWPHWAGGMPNDVPPRPGAPGYQQFIAHGQADQDQPSAPAGANGTAAAPAAPVFQTTPGVPAQPARAEAAARAAPPAPAPVVTQATPPPASDDTSVVHGGLY